MPKMEITLNVYDYFINIVSSHLCFIPLFMLPEKEITRISKFLSLVLRHQPETIGITLDENGWVNVNELIKKSHTAGVKFDFEILKHVVDTNNKKRFAFNDSLDKIRA